METLMENIGKLTEGFRGDPVRKWMQDHTEVPVVTVAFYLVLVLYVPQNIMAHRGPMNLRLVNILWNMLLTVFSLFGAYYCLPRLIETVTATHISGLTANPKLGSEANSDVLNGSLHTSACVWHKKMFFDGTVGFWVCAFIFSKIPEMFDTVLLVFQKKPVIFLHWYHHATVMLFCWHAYAYTIPSGLWFATMNYCVHSIMYFYYFICACGLRKVVRPIAPLITALQILQMVVGTGIVVYTYSMKHIFGRGCSVNNPNLRMGLMMYVSYFFLFAQLFHRNYIHSPTKSRSVALNGDNKKK